MDDETTTMPLTLGRRLWAIRSDVLPRLVEAHRAGTRGLERLGAIRAAAAAPVAARRSAGNRAGGSVAVIPLTGVITPRGSLLSYLFGGGGGGLVDFRDMFREAIASPDVGAIVLDVDSPGGLIDLVPETAAEIRAARGEKPIVAVANTMAASAAYWIATQADELVVTPSGDVGSVGVYIVHEDWSGANEQMGIKPTYVVAGKYKVEGNPDEPLSDDARTYWQQEVDDLYAKFVDDIAAGRGVDAATVRDQYGEGRTLMADRAAQAGMVDRVDTLENVVRDLLTPTGGSNSAAARVARVAPARLAQDPAPAGPDDEADPDDTPEPAPEPESVPQPPDTPEPEPVGDPEPHVTPDPDPDPAGGDPEPDRDSASRTAIAALLTG